MCVNTHPHRGTEERLNNAARILNINSKLFLLTWINMVLLNRYRILDKHLSPHFV